MGHQATSAGPPAEDAWALYAHHRARLTDALVESAPARGGRLCLLGAGECNDVDLERLSLAFSEIHLVDIDPVALGRAVSRQKPAVRSCLRPHARVDLSGMGSRLKKWKRRPPTVAQLADIGPLTTQALRGRLPAPFDVVASVCVLTQMAFAARDELGDGLRGRSDENRDPILPAVRRTLVATHLDTLIALTAAGGASVFVSDLTSSNLFRLDAIAPGRDLRDTMDEIVAAGACYHAANPMLIDELLSREVVRGTIDAPFLLDPWLWTGTLGRTYFVYALRLPRGDVRVR